MKVQLWDCNGTIAQQWSVYSDGTIRIGPGNTKCLDTENGGTGKGTKLIIWECHGSPNAVWTGLSVNNTTPTTPPPPPPPPASTDPNAGFSFTTSYYDYINKTTIAGNPTRTINVNYGSKAPFAGVGTDYFHTLWVGTFKAPATGTYTFSSEQDDGFALVIQLPDGQKQTVIDKWYTPDFYGTGSIVLTANQTYPLAVAVYDKAGNSYANLFWSGPGITGRPLFPNLR